MEPNVDRGMWSVVALLAAIVIGGIVLIAFPKISGKITNSMNDTVNKAFEGETPGWIQKNDEPNFVKVIGHEKLAKEHRVWASKLDNKVDLKKLDGPSGTELHIKDDGTVFAHAIKTENVLTGLEPKKLYKMSFYMDNKSENQIAITTMGRTSWGKTGKLFDDLIVPIGESGYYDFYFIPVTTKVSFFVRNYNEANKSKTDVILKEMSLYRSDNFVLSQLEEL